MNSLRWQTAKQCADAPAKANTSKTTTQQKKKKENSSNKTINGTHSLPHITNAK
jgi:hypothetical protein